MVTGEITILTIAGISLIVIFVGFLMLSRGWDNGSQSLAKIRVRVDDRYRRTIPADENEALKAREWLLGFVAAVIIITTTIALLGQH